MDSCPKELEPYDIAHENEIKELDYLQHMWWGTYAKSALCCAIDHCINGKNAKSEYIKEPIMQNVFDNTRLTKEEIYEKELQKALDAEEQWIFAGKQRRLPETII